MWGERRPARAPRLLFVQGAPSGGGEAARRERRRSSPRTAAEDAGRLAGEATEGAAQRELGRVADVRRDHGVRRVVRGEERCSAAHALEGRQVAERRLADLGGELCARTPRETDRRSWRASRRSSARRRAPTRPGARGRCAGPGHATLVVGRTAGVELRDDLHGRSGPRAAAVDKRRVAGAEQNETRGYAIERRGHGAPRPGAHARAHARIRRADRGRLHDARAERLPRRRERHRDRDGADPEDARAPEPGSSPRRPARRSTRSSPTPSGTTG